MRNQRGFYRVPQVNWPLRDKEGEKMDAPNGVLLLETTQYAYVHSAIVPNPVLVEAEGDLLAHTWAELYVAMSGSPASRDRIFWAEVDRPVKDAEPGAPDMKRLPIPRKEIEEEDVVHEDWRVPHAWGIMESIQEQTKLDEILMG